MWFKTVRTRVAVTSVEVLFTVRKSANGYNVADFLNRTGKLEHVSSL